MRISDWRSDVCSSDLLHHVTDPPAGLDGDHVEPGHHDLADDGVAELDDGLDEGLLVLLDGLGLHSHLGEGAPLLLGDDRTSVVSGKGVSVRVYQGGRCFIQNERVTITIITITN